MTEGKCGEGRDSGREMEVHEGKEGVKRGSEVGHKLALGVKVAERGGARGCQQGLEQSIKVKGMGALGFAPLGARHRQKSPLSLQQRCVWGSRRGCVATGAPAPHGSTGIPGHPPGTAPGRLTHPVGPHGMLAPGWL